MHFFEVNRNLLFNRAQALGYHLDIPAGRGIRWAPGEDKAVTLVRFGGPAVLHGFNRLCDGATSAERLEECLATARSRGFIREGG
jgi:urease beta subunit